MDKSERLVAYCGLVCSECDTYKATQANSHAERQRVAEKWSEQFGLDLTPNDINCYGCTAADDRVFPYGKDCELRVCVRQRDIGNCARCDDYGCDIMNKFLNDMSGFSEYLEAERSSL